MVWLINKVKKKLKHWSNQWISFSGRLTFLKSILEGIPIYWITISHIPRGVMECIYKMTFGFLCKKEKRYGTS